MSHIELFTLLAEAATQTDPDPQMYWSRFAAWLEDHRDRLLAALDGEIEGTQHDCSPSMIHPAGYDCGYPWCHDSSKSGVLWSFPKAPE